MNKYKFCKISKCGNSKAIILPKEWLIDIFGCEIKGDERFDLDYDKYLKIIFINKGNSKKIKKLGDSYCMTLDIKYLRNIFSDIYDLNVKTDSNLLKVAVVFNEKEKTIIVRKEVKYER